MNIPNNTEEWRGVKGYEGIYMVSNLGRIKSLSRKVKIRGDGYRMTEDRIIRASDGCGYLSFVACKNKTKKTLAIHRTVAESFLGHKPTSRNIVVDHIDNNPLNNNLSNLQVISIRDNLLKDKVFKKGHCVGVTKRTLKDGSIRWETSIMKNRKYTYLGTYDTQEKAKSVYESKLKQV